MSNGEANYRRFLNGDDQGMVEIIKEYNDTLTLFLNGYVHNIHIAEDLAEDVFFCLVVKKPKYTSKHSFKTWLFTIGRNQAINFLRKNAKILSLENNNLKHSEQDVEKDYIREQDKIQLHRAIQTLLPQYSEVLYLAYFELLPVREIARIVKKPEKQISNLLYRAKNALKDQLLKEGFEYEAL